MPSVWFLCDRVGCSYKTTRRNHLIQHTSCVHDKLRPFSCDRCDKRFGTREHLTQHVKSVHDKMRPCACDRFDKTFSTKGHLNGHVKYVHEKVRSLQCAFCEKMFVTQGNLNDHVKYVHEKLKPYACDKCPATFSFRRDLDVHIMRVHQNIRSFACETCGKTFTTQSDVNRHVICVHDKSRPYSCDQCDATFSLRGNLDQHVSCVHHKLQQFACDQCEMIFSTHQNLNRHILTHTEQKPFICPDEHCEYATTQLHNLKRHSDCHHGENAGKRRKLQEYRVANALDTAGILYKREHRVDFACVETGPKSWASVDFVLTFGRHVVFLEVDEDQHRSLNYSVSCEVARMARVVESLACGGNTLPVLFVRYNPDGFKVDGVTKRTWKRHRESTLITYLKSLENAKDDVAPFAVQYMFYDVAGGLPVVFDDPEYSDIMKEFCLDVIV